MGISIADDDGLTREAGKAALMFYYSEMARHENDISMIWDCICKIKDRFDFSVAEQAAIQLLSRKYIDFDVPLGRTSCADDQIISKKGSAE